MRNIRANKKALKIAAVLAAVLLTATIITATAIQNQNQNTCPLINAYLLGVSPSPNNAIILPKMDIDSSRTLNGGVYTETINVLADNIVIDGNGSTVQGPANGTEYGFYLSGRNNVTIFNVTVTGWQYGFYLVSSSYNNLTNNTATNNDLGFYLVSSSNNNLTNNTANSEGDRGFWLASSSNNNLTNNTANNNPWYGFYLASSSSNILSGNTANNNGQGFWLDSSSNNNLTGNIANNNNVRGFWLYRFSNYNTLTGNTATNNNWGFSLDFSSNNNLTGNTANNNYQYGFILYQTSNNNTLSGNTANNNTGNGFFLSDRCNNNNLNGNNATNNNYGFYLQYSSNNNLTGNTALNSKSGGYSWISGSINNDFTGSVEAYYLRVNVTDVLGFPISGAEVNVVTDGTSVYRSSYFGGSDPQTDSNGVTPWIAVAYRTFITNDTTITNTTTVTVYYQGIPIAGSNPRTVDMSTSHQETFTVDTTAPTVSITSPTNGTLFNTGSIITTTWTVSVPSIVDHYAVRIDGGNWTSVGTSTSHNFTGLSDGSHTVDVRVFDLAGNNATASVSFIVDTTPPTVAITSPSNSMTFNTGSVTVNWTGSDTGGTGISYCDVRIDNGSWINMGTSTSYTFSNLSDGLHIVDVRAWDLAGNNATASVSFTVASWQPALSLILLSLAGTQGGTSPMVYAAVGVACVVGVVLAVGLVYYFRRVKA
ncbi:MAG: NosD domain-containing protein [Candidatus Freyarchaeum deiterrae]